MRIVRLKGESDRPWMVNLYGEHDRLICVCGPYGADDRDRCIDLFSEGWLLAESREMVRAAQRMQRTVTRSAVERTRLAEFGPPPLRAEFLPPEGKLERRGRPGWRRQYLRDLEADRRNQSPPRPLSQH